MTIRKALGVGIFLEILIGFSIVSGPLKATISYPVNDQPESTPLEIRLTEQDKKIEELSIKVKSLEKTFNNIQSGNMIRKFALPYRFQEKTQ